MRLQRFLHQDKTRLLKMNGFGGYDNTHACKANEFSNTENLSSKRAPFISPMSARYYISENVDDFFLNGNDLFTVIDNTFYKNNTSVGRLPVSENASRDFSVIGKLLCIMPDKYYYNLDSGEFGAMNSMTQGRMIFEDGELYGESACMNTITCDGVDLGNYFKKGDGIVISNTNDNDGTYIIREIKNGKLSFDEYAFKGAGEYFPILSRDIPDLDFSFECNNRLWGVKGDTIFASALGDPFNFNKLDGISTDSYFKEIYSAGEFTGSACFGSTPIFFKENMIYRIYGDTPSGFHVESRDAPGISMGCEKTAVNINGRLYYAGTDGIYVYTSGSPVKISEPLGEFKAGKGCAGGDGGKYYISVSNAWGEFEDIDEVMAANEKTVLYSYDTHKNIWYKCNEELFLKKILSGQYGSEGTKQNTVALSSNGDLFTLADNIPPVTPDGTYMSREEISSFAESGKLELEGASRIKRIKVNAELYGDSRLFMYISFDGGEYILLGEIISPDGKMSSTFFYPENKRFEYCNLKLSGTGDYTVSEITIKYALSEEA